MAIDSIENNELSALAPSRLGLRQFANDGAKGTPKMMNFTGGDDFVNLFGSRVRKKSAFRQQVRDKYGAIPSDCQAVKDKIDVINSDYETLVKRSAGRVTLEIKEKLDETNIVLGEHKSALLKLGCKAQEAQLQAQVAETKAAQTLETLTKLGESQVSAAKADLLGTSAAPAQGGGMNKNIIIFGVIGVILIGGVYFYMKKK
jgi:hypothetical protein